MILLNIECSMAWVWGCLSIACSHKERGTELVSATCVVTRKAVPPEGDKYVRASLKHIFGTTILGSLQHIVLGWHPPSVKMAL